MDSLPGPGGGEQQADDGGDLDDLQDVVDVALGENLGPSEPENPWELQVILTLLALVLLGVGVIRMLMLPQYVTDRPDPPPAPALAVVVR